MDPFSALVISTVLAWLLTKTVGEAITDYASASRGQTPPSQERWRARQAAREAKGAAPRSAPGPWRQRWENAGEAAAEKAAIKHQARMEHLRDTAPEAKDRHKRRLERRADRSDRWGRAVSRFVAQDWDAIKGTATGVTAGVTAGAAAVRERREEAAAWKENSRRDAAVTDQPAVSDDSTPDARGGGPDLSGDSTDPDKAAAQNPAPTSSTENAGGQPAAEQGIRQSSAETLAADRRAAGLPGGGDTSSDGSAPGAVSTTTGTQEVTSTQPDTSTPTNPETSGGPEQVATAGSPPDSAVTAGPGPAGNNGHPTDTSSGSPDSPQHASGTESAQVLPFRRPTIAGENTASSTSNTATPREGDTPMSSSTTTTEITDLNSAISFGQATSGYCETVHGNLENQHAELEGSAVGLDTEAAAYEQAQAALSGRGFDGSVIHELAAAGEAARTASAGLRAAMEQVNAAKEQASAAKLRMNSLVTTMQRQQALAEQVSAHRQDGGVAADTSFYDGSA